MNQQQKSKRLCETASLSTMNDESIADDNGDSIVDEQQNKRNNNSKASTQQKHECPECGKCFKWQHKLKIHRLTHRDNRFECWQCHKG